MCGICGRVNFRSKRPVEEREITSMMEAIAHRGPDQRGLYLSQAAGLGHLRLSIIDLESGRQPISNEDGTLWIVFNGEIYNFRELRLELEKKGHSFKTNTDTEVIIHCYEQYGLSAIEKLRGMFSFAIWDDRAKTLLLVRDRVGIKPLYYYLDSNCLVFASEIKALLADQRLPRRVNANALVTFLSYYYVPGSETLFDGIKKLPPGHFLQIKDGNCEIRRYWDIVEFYQPKRKSTDDLEAELDEILSESVRLHMISDVPVGFLLSGGVDSTGLLSYAIGGSQDIMGFTVGFDDKDFADERYYAGLAAKQYGLEHHKITISPSQFLDFIPQFIRHMEEPVCEPPAIALFFVSQLAREHVTVLISGEGGDEAFAGYQNYRNLALFELAKKLVGKKESFAFKIASNILLKSGCSRIRPYADLLNLPLESYYYSRSSNPFKFFNKNASELYTEGLYELITSNQHKNSLDSIIGKTNRLGTLDTMLYIDLMTWLPDDLLIKADKMTMANSLELRVPLLDHKLLEFAASLPPDRKVWGWRTKHILKKVLAPKIPAEIINRGKTGFPVPYAAWMKNDGFNYVHGILTEKRTLDRGYFNKNFLLSFLDDPKFYSSHPKEVFSLLVLEMWHRVFLDSSFDS